MRKYIFLTLLSLNLFLFACGDVSDEASNKDTDGSKETSSLSIIMNEWDVKPTPNYKMGKHIKPGDLNITLTNAGQLEHNLFVLNQSSYDDFNLLDDGTADLSEIEVLLEIDNVMPGNTGTGSISNLEPGTYAFICNVPGHYASGTVGKFIVR